MQKLECLAHRLKCYLHLGTACVFWTIVAYESVVDHGSSVDQTATGEGSFGDGRRKDVSTLFCS